MAGKALERYHAILDGDRKARYLETKDRGVRFEPDDDEMTLWSVHSDSIGDARLCDGERTLMSLKSELGRRIMTRCRLCEHRCMADRSAGKTGHCGVLEARVSSEFLHMGEEPDLVPSYTVFFSGCTLSCVYCQNWDISTDPRGGTAIDTKALALMIRERAHAGARNVNWVGGDPTSDLPFIMEVLEQCEVNIPQVWNSNMYLSEEGMVLLDGVVDVYLTDFKYGNDACANRLSGVDRYTEVVRRNHLLARRQCEMIVRHLVLPGHVECCTKPILEWIARNLDDVKVNVMAQYRPEHRARDYPDISNPLPGKDYRMAIAIADELDLDLVD
mgnify:CR=1 FL=1